MYAKIVLVAAALAPVALAQQTVEPYNFNCNRGQYGYGWGNGGGDNNNDDRSFADIINHFADIAGIYQNCTTTTRSAVGGNIPQIAQSLFNQFEEAYCQTVALSDSLGRVRETDNEQHDLCHAKSFNDLTLNNWMMNMEVSLSSLKGSFINNNLPSISSCTLGLHNAFMGLSGKVNQVAPVCATQENTATSLVSKTLQVISQLYHN